MIITDDLTIQGDGRITVSGNNASRIFQLRGATTDVEITHLTLSNGFAAEPGIFGSAGGGIQNVSGHLTLAHVTMANNQAVASLESGGVATAGAIDNFFGASLVVRHSRFIGNQARGAVGSAGGAILMEGSLTVTDSQFIGNEATTRIGAGPLDPLQGGAGGGAIAIGPGSAVSVSHSHFTGNVARGGNGLVLPGIADGNGGPAVGGAIFSYPFSGFAEGVTTLSVDHTIFRDNQAIGGTGGAGGEGSGGAIGTSFLSTARITHSAFLSNAALGGTGGTGAVRNPGGAGGRAHGGALFNAGGAVTVEQSTFLGNTAQGGVGGPGRTGTNGGQGGAGVGGALANLFGTLTVTTSLVAANRATGGAGGIRGGSDVLGSGMNQGLLPPVDGFGSGGGTGGHGQGGGLWVGAGTTVTIRNSTVTGNQALGGAVGADGSASQGRGSGIYVTPGATVQVDRYSFTRIVGNHAFTSDDDVFGNLLLLL